MLRGAAALPAPDRGALPNADGAASPPAGRSAAAARRLDRWIVLAAFAVAALTGLLGEKIDINNGLGWDGATYGQIAKDPYGQIVVRGWEPAVIQRIGPFVAAHLLLRPFFSPIEDVQVVRAFIVANVLGITLGCWLVVKTLDRLGAGPRTKWVAAAALVLNFCVAKWFSYYPVLTDLPGFVIGAGLVYAFVGRQRALLYLLTFLAAFTWPAAYYEGLILTVWEPFRAEAPPAEAEGTLMLRLALGGAAVLALAFAAWATYLVQPEHYAEVKWHFHPLMYEVMWLAIPLVTAYVFVSFWYLLRSALPLMLRAVPRLVMHWNTWLAAAVLVVGAQLLVKRLATADAGLELDVYPHMVTTAIFRPGMFFLAHVVFFGPVVLLAAFAWPGCCRVAARLGPGLALAVGVMLLLAIGSESRRVTNFLPLLVVLAVMAHDLEAWSWRQIVGFGVLCAITSKVWFPIGPLLTPENLSPRLFMNLGPWMDLGDYLVQLAALLVVVPIVWLLCRGPRRLDSDRL